MDQAQPASLTPTDPRVTAFLARRHQLFIGGAWREPAAVALLDVHDPATGEVIARVPCANAQDVDAAVKAAAEAFTNGAWTGLPPAERERILLRFADAVEANAEELAQLETLNQGKSINIARHVDIGGAPAYMRYIAGLTTKLTGETLDVSIGAIPGAKFTAYTRREPLGVVAAIAPWNFPMMIGLWKIMPALAAGCTVVLKPSEVTPLTSLRLAELAAEAGLPAGVLNLITGDGATGRALVDHPLVSKVTFTGSTETGKAIALATAGRLVRTSLELGGKNPAIFLKDVPIDQAVGGALLGGFFNNGQVCAASSRLYVARETYGAFVEALVAAVDGLSIGPGMDASAQVNPVVSAAHRDKVIGSIETARRDGARIVAGGDLPNRPGYYVRPTVIVDAGPDLAISRQEVFGPVVTVTAFDDEAEALRLANDTSMGLTASLWTNDLKKVLDYVPRLQAGTVWVNSHNVLDPNMPFGGFKESGIGRDFGLASLEGYTELKSVCMAH
ncbi:MAG: aldehyde dehydrogenase family protein [Phenylobacterium sp.]|uniref:aldehyde dehydrogenase family protein n=1 Tax=Phenylobacterium sp. TaxID=1871053 RepID=UPI002734A38D|nr:aldehyde dehydrogenase family protein [Phenylobacterium sp.]MDP3749567.1 aldehyde dehydrogenase family protein [Phenylobacterium sp.]